MVIRIDLEDARPLEDQIAAGLRQALAQGGVSAGADLPSVRQLAADLGGGRPDRAPGVRPERLRRRGGGGEEVQQQGLEAHGWPSGRLALATG